MQKIGTAETDFFREVGGAHEYLCRSRAVDDVITSTCSLLRRSHNKRSMRSKLHTEP